MSPRLAITAALDAAAAALETISPFAKAVVPAALALAVAVVNSVITKRFDAVTITSLALGLVSAVATYLVPNKTKPTPTPISGSSGGNTTVTFVPGAPKNTTTTAQQPKPITPDPGKPQS